MITGSIHVVQQGVVQQGALMQVVEKTELINAFGLHAHPHLDPLFLHCVAHECHIQLRPERPPNTMNMNHHRAKSI